MMQESELEPGSVRTLMVGTPALPRGRLAWARWLTWLGHAGLVTFAGVALISSNREAGLLTLGAFIKLSSPIRGDVQVGLAYLLVPFGALLWLAGRWRLSASAARATRWHLGPLPIVAPLSILIVLTLLHVSPLIGWADILFVLAGLGLLVLAYFFVLWDGPRTSRLAGLVAGVGGVQALVGIGQFLAQRDLGLRWLGELALSPATPGASVLGGSVRVLRAYGLMRHPNALGAILPLSLLAALSLRPRAAGRWRFAWLGLVLVILAGLVLSFSRAGWVAALAGVVVYLLASRQLGWARLRGWVPLALAASVVLIALVSLAPSVFAGRMLGAVGAGNALEQGSAAERAYALQAAWAIIARWPLWGVGTRQYVPVVARLIQVAPRESLLVESTPLVLWAELGLAGPLAWLGLGAAALWLGCRRPASPDLALATAWIAALQVVCLFQAFFWPTHELWQGSLWLGLALGLWARARSARAWPASHEDRLAASPAEVLSCG